MKCLNCDKLANYWYNRGGKTYSYYCQDHLPRFLYAARAAGDLNPPAIEVVVPTVEEEAPKSKKKKLEPVVDPEPIVDEVLVEEELPVEPEADAIN